MSTRIEASALGLFGFLVYASLLSRAFTMTPNMDVRISTVLIYTSDHTTSNDEEHPRVELALRYRGSTSDMTNKLRDNMSM